MLGSVASQDEQTDVGRGRGLSGSGVGAPRVASRRRHPDRTHQARGCAAVPAQEAGSQPGRRSKHPQVRRTRTGWRFSPRPGGGGAIPAGEPPARRTIGLLGCWATSRAGGVKASRRRAVDRSRPSSGRAPPDGSARRLTNRKAAGSRRRRANRASPSGPRHERWPSGSSLPLRRRLPASERGPREVSGAVPGRRGPYLPRRVRGPRRSEVHVAARHGLSRLGQDQSARGSTWTTTP